MLQNMSIGKRLGLGFGLLLALVALVAVHATLPLLLHQALELRDQPAVRLLVVRLVREHDGAVAIERHAVVGRR